jgi:hypothetical protein
MRAKRSCSHVTRQDTAWGPEGPTIVDARRWPPSANVADGSCRRIPGAVGHRLLPWSPPGSEAGSHKAWVDLADLPLCELQCLFADV